MEALENESYLKQDPELPLIPWQDDVEMIAGILGIDEKTSPNFRLIVTRKNRNQRRQVFASSGSQQQKRNKIIARGNQRRQIPSSSSKRNENDNVLQLTDELEEVAENTNRLRRFSLENSSSENHSDKEHDHEDFH